MCVKDRETKRQHKENSGQPAGKLHEHIRGLRAKYVFGHTATERRAEPFTLRPLHQDHQDHEQCDEHVDREQYVDENVHQRAGNMAETRGL